MVLPALCPWLAGCGGESDGRRSEDIEGAGAAVAPSPAPPADGLPAVDRDRGARPREAPGGHGIVIRRGRASARVDLSSGVPVVTVGDGRYSLARPDGALDREEVERLLEDLEAAGAPLEVELEASAETPGKLLEELVFFLEEKGKVPIVSSPRR